MGDPPPEFEDGVGSCKKNGLSADLEDVQLHLNHMKMGSGKRIFEGSFGWFIGSGRAFWSHEWVTLPLGLRMGKLMLKNWFVCRF